MRHILRFLTLPIRLTITIFILFCTLILSCSGIIFGIASSLLAFLGIIVLTYSVKNSLILFALAFLVSPLGLPMVAVHALSILSSVRSFLRFA